MYGSDFDGNHKLFLICSLWHHFCVWFNREMAATGNT